MTPHDRDAAAGTTSIDPQLRDRILARIRRIPIVETLAMRFDAFGSGTCRMTVPYDRRYDGVFESFHGGILITCADSAACFAVMTLTGPDEVMTTTDMSIRFLAPCLTDLRVEASVLKLGRTLAPVQVDLLDAKETLVAVAQVTYMRLPMMPHRVGSKPHGGSSPDGGSSPHGGSAS